MNVFLEIMCICATGKVTEETSAGRDIHIIVKLVRALRESGPGQETKQDCHPMDLRKLHWAC